MSSTLTSVPHGFGTTSNSQLRPYDSMGRPMIRNEAATEAAPSAMPSLPAPQTPKTPILSATLPVAGNSAPLALPPAPKAWVSVISELCKGCELCVHACPSGNLTMSPGLNSKGYHPAVFAYDGKRGPCTACGICYWVCPDMAISEIRRLKQ